MAMLAMAALLPAIAAAAQPDADILGGSPGKHARAARSKAVAPLERRVALLAAELQLTPEQQLHVRALLERQRQEVRQLWSDNDMAPALRIGRMQAVADQTADAIRGVLDDNQKKKYIQPRQRDVAVGTSGADLETWMAEARK